MRRLVIVITLIAMAAMVTGCVKDISSTMTDMLTVEPRKTPEQKALEKYKVPPEAYERAKKLSGKEHFSPNEIAGLYTYVTQYGPLDPNLHMTEAEKFKIGKGIFPTLYAFVESESGVKTYASGFARWKTLLVYGNEYKQYATKLIPRREQEAFRDNFLKTYLTPGMTTADIDRMVAEKRLAPLDDGSFVCLLGQSAVGYQDNGLNKDGINYFDNQVAYFVARFQPLFAGNLITSVTASVGGYWISRYMLSGGGQGVDVKEDQGFFPAENSIVTTSLTEADLEAALKAGKITASEAATAEKAVGNGPAPTLDIQTVDIKRDTSFVDINQRITDELSALRKGPGIQSSWMWLPPSDPDVRYRMGTVAKALYGGNRDYTTLLTPLQYGKVAPLAKLWLEKCGLIEKRAGKDAANDYAGMAALAVLTDTLFADNLAGHATYYGPGVGGGSFTWPTKRNVTVLGNGPANSADYKSIDRDIALQIEDIKATAYRSDKACSKIRSRNWTLLRREGPGFVAQAIKEQASCDSELIFGLILEKYQMILEREGDGPADYYGWMTFYGSERGADRFLFLAVDKDNQQHQRTSAASAPTQHLKSTPVDKQKSDKPDTSHALRHYAGNIYVEELIPGMTYTVNCGTMPIGGVVSDGATYYPTELFGKIIRVPFHSPGEAIEFVGKTAGCF